MGIYREQIEDAKQEAANDYFKWQQETQRRKKALYISILILVIFTPILINGLVNIKKEEDFRNKVKNVEKTQQEIQKTVFKILGTDLDKIQFRDNQTTIYMEDLMNSKYSETIDYNILDPDTNHQCLGYIVVTRTNDSEYIVDTKNYCTKY